MTMLGEFRELLRKKQYQIEVTFAIYMFTPYEKFVFWSIVFLLFSLTFIAAILYLPHHISLLAGRAWYYINGETIDVVASARGVFKDVFGGAASSSSSSVVVTTAKETVETVVREL